jgi:hypothetical protein
VLLVLYHLAVYLVEHVKTNRFTIAQDMLLMSLLMLPLWLLRMSCQKLILVNNVSYQTAVTVKLVVLITYTFTLT